MNRLETLKRFRDDVEAALESDTWDDVEFIYWLLQRLDDIIREEASQ